MQTIRVRERTDTHVAVRVCLEVIVVLAGSVAHAQIVHVSAPLPCFETATIKPSDPNRVPGSVTPQPNVFKSYGGTVRDLVRIAYGLPPGSSKQVLGGTGWIDNERFDIDAKIADEMFDEMKSAEPQQRYRQILAMVQCLLTERFHLKSHFETREMPVYTLVLAHGEPKLRVSQPDEPAQLRAARKRPSVMEITATSQTLDSFIGMPFLGLGGEPVLNKTGLTGKYDFVLDWSPQLSAADPSTTAGGDAPDLFTALQEQLGLKLVRSKGPVEVVVIDSIDQPTNN